MKPATVIRLPLALLTVLFLALPLLTFLICWLKAPWAILSAISLLFGGWHLIRAWPVASPEMKVGDVFFLAIFSLSLAALAGIGGFAPQHFDWAKHNAVLQDCLTQPWPVVLTDGPVRWPLVYYLAYYLPAALVGKMAGYPAAQMALWVWSGGGVMLACGWFAQLSRLPIKMAAPAFFLFSGLIFVANLLVQLLGLPDNYHGWTGIYPNECWARIWQFAPHFWMLEWAPGQALAGWLSAGMFLSCPGPLRLLCFGFLFTCDLLWSPFAGIGLGLLAFFLACREGVEWPAKSPGPVLALVLPCALLAAFFASKMSPQVAARFPKIAIVWFIHFQDAPGPLASVFLLLLFVVFEFGVFLVFTRAAFPESSRERRWADACGLSLVCLLPVTVGYYNDLSLRASAVPLFGLALLTARTIAYSGLAPAWRRWLWLVVVIGALTPLIEIGTQSWDFLNRRYDPSVVPHPVAALVHLPADGFNFFGAQYVGSTNSFFWKRLARSNDF